MPLAVVGGASGKRYVVDESPEIAFGQDDDPDQFVEGDVLLDPAGADRDVALFDIDV